MGKTYEELTAELSPERRARVGARTAELIAEEQSLRDLRQARQLTRQHMAKKLGVKQHSISRLEQRSDMLLSMLQDYVGKMGGELVLNGALPRSRFSADRGVWRHHRSSKSSKAAHGDCEGAFQSHSIRACKTVAVM
jgi:hypothetical protein